MPALGRQCCPCVSCMVGLFDDHTRRKRFWLGRERVRWPICVSNTNAPERVLSSLRWPSTPPRAASGPGRRPSFLTPTPTWLPYPSSERIVSITASGRPFLLSGLMRTLSLTVSSHLYFSSRFFVYFRQSCGEVCLCCQTGRRTSLLFPGGSVQLPARAALQTYLLGGNEKVKAHF